VRYAIKWARQPHTLVKDVAELDTVLDQVTETAAATGHPHVVSIYPADHDGDWPSTLQLGVGHPERAAAHWISATEAGTGYEPHVPPWSAPIGFDLGGVATELPAEDTRLTPQVAREAAREYVRTGHRPTCVHWRSA